MIEDKRSKAECIADFAEYISPGKVRSYKLLGAEIVPHKREGCRIWDMDGKSYLNLRSSGGVFNLGHRPREIMEVLIKALETYDLGDHLLLSAPRSLLARRLAELTPGDIHYTVFGVSGGEAIDLAIKLARAHTHRPGIVSAELGYHGHTGFALATGEAEFKQFFGPLAPGFVQVPFGDIAALKKVVDQNTAAVIFETIPATAGMLIPPDDYYPGVREICDKTGALLIIDEVQAGLGRTGRLWAIDEYKVVPDIMVLAKGLAGSLYPLSATCFRKPLGAFFEEHPFVHVSTAGGSELGCLVTLATLERLTNPQLMEHVNKMARRFADGFAALKKKYPALLAEVRQKGLMIGLKHAGSGHGPLLAMNMFARGMISMFAHNDASVLQIMPPLIISEAEVDEVLEALDQSYKAMSAA